MRNFVNLVSDLVKKVLLGLRRFLAIEIPLKIIKRLFVSILSWLFSHIEKQLNKKTKVSFKIYDITNWETNKYNNYISTCHMK